MEVGGGGQPFHCKLFPDIQIAGLMDTGSQHLLLLGWHHQGRSDLVRLAVGRLSCVGSQGRFVPKVVGGGRSVGH